MIAPRDVESRKLNSAEMIKVITRERRDAETVYYTIPVRETIQRFPRRGGVYNCYTPFSPRAENRASERATSILYYPLDSIVPGN